MPLGASGEMQPIVIVDYGMGNLRSVANALEAVGAAPEISDVPLVVRRAPALVLPGVGAFGDGMESLRSRGLADALGDAHRRGTPILGLCLGMQLLASSSTEYGEHQGLGWLPGRVVPIEPDGRPLRVPHVGWNAVRFPSDSRLFAGLGEEQDFYFVHSYVLVPEDPAAVAGICEYGTPFAAAVESAMLFGTQFHPEKSQRAGLAVLRNFVELCSRRG